MQVAIYLFTFGFEEGVPGEPSVKQQTKIFDFICVKDDCVFKCYVRTVSGAEGESDMRGF